MEDNGDALTLDYAPSGKNGSATITAKLGSAVIDVEKIDFSRSKQRADFARRICDGRPGIDRDAIDAELLRIAADLAARGSADGEQPEGDGATIDPGQVIRPELFHRPEGSGLCLPTLVSRSSEGGTRVVGRWLLFIQWPDGRREKLALPTRLDIDGGSPLYFHPIPADPDAQTYCGWTADSRSAWLAGAEPPEPADLFRELCAAVAWFVDWPAATAPGHCATLALWTLFTYVYPLWDAAPYLHFSGPAGSGKTRCFEVLSRLVWRPLSSSNLSGPAVFRTLHDAGGTLLFDEAEQLRRGNDPAVGELLSMLLSGYKRGGCATRLDKVGDGFKTVRFQVYGPKGLASINPLPSALATRCIEIPMFRTASDSPKPRRRIDEDPSRWQRLRDAMHATALSRGGEFIELAKRNDICPAMSGRNFELWSPLLALARWLEDHGADGLHTLVSDHALRSIDAARTEQAPDHDAVLLQALADELRGHGLPAPGDILTRAQEAEPNLFKTWTTRAVSTHLRRYGVETTRSNGRRVYRVDPADLTTIGERYGFELS